MSHEPHAPKGLDEQVRALGHLLTRRGVARDPNVVFEEGLGVGDRAADRLAAFGGSWTFVGICVAAIAAWIAFNAVERAPLDPFPFILLNLCLSCVAALQAPVIMMSQNRQAAKDRSDAQHDYEVNLKAEMEVATLHLKVDELVELQRRQLALLEELAGRGRTA
ncbi:MAG TPA: DUF1003 domain-containing protein [Candidatus Polarisedimenticolaceae bacterium]|nr:DUF1003 domain-containing protein [Candidatus Polarisedimenticolaceae bacterium]